MKELSAMLFITKKKSGKKRLTTSEFVSRAQAVHGNQYIYEKTEYLTSRSKVVITCRKHGDFNQLAFNHLAGQHCKKCSSELKARTTSEFIELSRAVHGNLYDYSKTEYTGNGKKLIITCQVHNDFEQFASGHLSGRGCKKCAEDAAKGVYTKKKTTTDEFILESKEVHGDTFIYDKTIFNGLRNKVTITCRKHGNFEQVAYAHRKGHGCRKCISTNRSKIADEWLDSLNISEEHRESFIPEYPSRSLDAYVAETNTVYQFHGNYWHGNLKIFKSDEVNAHIGKTMGELNKRTNEWDQKIRDLNYNLVVMWESDWTEQKSLIISKQ